MLLTIVIVNYNVKYFLELCLLSVQKAVAGIDAEVIVVDNASGDNSVEFIKMNFPWVKIIANKKNAGFSIANNQAAAIAGGEFILFLNPDTILPEDCFFLCIQELKINPSAAALGVKMIDGSGVYLPESKRGFPSPWNSFTKLSGLSGLFPRSKRLSGYYHGHLDNNKVHSVDALAGAFMMVRTAVFRKSGGFDEQFFMYGEDLDLSYRFQKMGYKNLYFPGTTIIHFKGESTRRDIKYVKQFYKAMIQFVHKHFNTNPIYPFFLKAGIGIASVLSGIRTNIPKPPVRVMTDPIFEFTGDGQSIEEAKMITGNQRKSGSRKVVVFCEGRDFHFKEMIGIILNSKPDEHWFHAAGSSSVLASADKNGMGKIISAGKIEQSG